MLILGIFLVQKSAKYFLRKTHFKMTIFEFAAVWSPLPLPLPLLGSWNQSWALDTFFCIRYPIFRYFDISIRYQYSDTFANLLIRYPIFDIDTFFAKIFSCKKIKRGLNRKIVFLEKRKNTLCGVLQICDDHRSILCYTLHNTVSKI
jgi:hypothetical protein